LASGEGRRTTTAAEATVVAMGATKLRTYTVRHGADPEALLPLLQAYRDAVNRVLEELWGQVEWGQRSIPGKKQYRLLPKFKADVHSNEYRRQLRNRILAEWPYAAHWADSAIKTAYSIFKSWRKNYAKG